MNINNNDRLIKLAIVGCGEITRQGHLPGVRLAKKVSLVALVDNNTERAKTVAKEFAFKDGIIAANVMDITDSIDAAIIALPHHLHESVSCALLEKGIHVLVEKPMATSSEGCDRMIQVAYKHGSVLAVGMTRRFAWASQFLKEAVNSKLFGEVKEFSVQDGNVYSWPSATPFILDRRHSGGGVLIGNGSHVLDMMIWLFGEADRVITQTDSFGGIEANCLLQVRLANGVNGSVELSRTHALSNTWKVIFEKATLVVPLFSNKVVIETGFGKSVITGSVQSSNRTNNSEPTFIQAIADQTDDFAKAIKSKISPAISGADARRAVALIEKCYQTQETMKMPWLNPIAFNDTQQRING